MDRSRRRRHRRLPPFFLILTNLVIPFRLQLLSKSPDARYNSAIGLKNDLMECQKRLQLSCANADAPNGLNNIDLIPSFELGQHDMFLELTIPGDLVRLVLLLLGVRALTWPVFERVPVWKGEGNPTDQGHHTSGGF